MGKDLESAFEIGELLVHDSYVGHGFVALIVYIRTYTMCNRILTSYYYVDNGPQLSSVNPNSRCTLMYPAYSTTFYSEAQGEERVYHEWLEHTVWMSKHDFLAANDLTCPNSLARVTAGVH